MSNATGKMNRVVFFNLLGPVILNGINFFTVPVFTRLLGVENYGVYTLYASYQSILVLFMGLQMQASISTASVYYEGRARERVLSVSLFISLVSSAVFSVIIFVFIRPLSRAIGLSPAMIVLMVAESAGMAAVQWALTRFTYEKKALTNFLFSTLIAVAGVVISLLLILCFLQNIKPYFSYALGHTIPYFAFGIGFYIYFLTKGKTFFGKKEWAFCLSLCLPVVFHNLANTLLHQLDKIMIRNMMNVSSTGVYGFAVTFANVLSIVFNALNVTWVPFYHDDAKAGNTDALKKKTFNYTFLFTCVTVGFIMVMPEVVKIFAQRDFWPSIKIIPILSVGIYFVFLYTFPVNFEFYYKRTKTIAIGTALACLCNMVLNYFLIRRIGMIGAAVATMISFGLLYLFHLFMARVVVKEPYHYPYKFFYVFLAVVIAFASLFYAIIDSPAIRWLLFLAAALLLVGRVVRNRSVF